MSCDSSELESDDCAAHRAVDGGIPPALSALRSLTVLDVSNCGLTGREPA